MRKGMSDYLWKGHLTTEPDTLGINVHRLIYDDGLNRISFMLHGSMEDRDSDGGFLVSGIAAQQMEGHYLSPSISYKCKCGERGESSA